MKHNVILVLLDGLDHQVARRAMGHRHAYVETGGAQRHLEYAPFRRCDIPNERLGAPQGTQMCRKPLR